MSAKDWERLETIYLEAMQLPLEQRNDFVKEKSADQPELLEALTRMITVEEDTAEDFLLDLQSRIMSEAAEVSGIPLGTRIGKYTLKDQIGKGGMGTVYRAVRDTGDFDQKVAIKVLYGTSLTPQTEAAFLNEQQIMANLSHPNIATILDGGIYEGRYPYIVMEYVEGVPIDEYLKSKNANRKEILSRLRDVAGIVQFAHQNLILHLDLKPSNIIVDREGHIKLLDFGISQILEEDTSLQDPAFKLSLKYAAPEQYSKAKVSTATDVFMLGVLAYVLLTGQFPFSGSSEVNQRGPVLVSKDLGEQLRALVIKCLESDQEKRYDSASQLATDLERYMSGRPISAKSYSAVERAGLYVRRNKITVSAVSIVIFALVVSSVFSYTQAEKARKERDYALSTKKFIVDLFSRSNPFENAEVDYREYSVLNFLGDKRSEVLANDQLDDQTRFELTKILHDTYNGLSLHTENLQTSADLLSVAIETGSESKIGLANYLRGRAFAHQYAFDSADHYFAEALKYREAIGKEDNYFAADLRNQLALNFHFQGAFDTAKYWYQKAISMIPASSFESEYYPQYLIILSNYSNLLRSTGQLDSAILLANQVIDNKVDYYNDPLNPNIMSNYSDRALVYMETGKYEEAEQDFRTSLEIGYDVLDSGNFKLEIILGNYVILKTLKQEYEEGLVLAKQQFEEVKSKYEPGNMNVIYAQLPMAQCYLGLKMWEEAATNLSEGLSWLEKMNRPGFVLHGIYLLELGRAHIGQRKWDAADNRISEAMQIFQEIYPDDHYRIAVTKVRKGRILMQSNYEKGREMIQEALPVLEKSPAKTAAFIEEAKLYLADAS
jgi:serine/threonine-protein kinase